jgi:hypothetical protein
MLHQHIPKHCGEGAGNRVFELFRRWTKQHGPAGSKRGQRRLIQGTRQRHARRGCHRLPGRIYPDFTCIGVHPDGLHKKPQFRGFTNGVQVHGDITDRRELALGRRMLKLAIGMDMTQEIFQSPERGTIR